MAKMEARKRIALVAHDAQKQDMLAWVAQNKDVLAGHELYGTGTTGAKVREATGLAVNLLKSGPLGGDQQLGAMIATDEIDILIFFTDPLTALPHDVDVKALLRISTLKQVAVACNRATADFIISARQLNGRYEKGRIE